MTDAILRCSFCSKGESEVLVLIAGPNVFICDECVEASMDILIEKGHALHPDIVSAVNHTLNLLRKPTPPASPPQTSLSGTGTER